MIASCPFQDETRSMVPVPALYKVPKLVIIVEVISISPRQTLELINPGLHPSSFSVSHHIDPAFCLPHETRAENFCPNTSHLPSVSGLRRKAEELLLDSSIFAKSSAFPSCAHPAKDLKQRLQRFRPATMACAMSCHFQTLSLHGAGTQ